MFDDDGCTRYDYTYRTHLEVLFYVCLTKIALKPMSD